MDTTELLKLSPSDFDMIIQGLEALKHRDFASDLMGGMFEIMLTKKPEEMTEDERAKYEKRQLEKIIEAQIKEEKREKFNREVDILKSKVTLIVQLNDDTKPKGEKDEAERPLTWLEDVADLNQSASKERAEDGDE